MTNKVAAVRSVVDTQKSSRPKRVVRAEITWIGRIANISGSAVKPIEAAPIGWVRPIYGNQMSELYCDGHLNENAQDSGDQRAKDQILNGQIQGDGRNARCEQHQDVSPHDDPVGRPTAARIDEQGESRIDRRSHDGKESREYVIHDGRPRTQLFLTLRLIWRSGKLIRNNKIDRPLRRSARADRPPRSVSLACVAALTGALLLLAGCAGAHDGCGAPYAFSEKSGFVGRPA